MRNEATTQDDFAFGLSACTPSVIEVKALSHLTLEVKFADGLTGRVRFAPTHLSGVFQVLKNPEFFKKVSVSHGAVTWAGDLDIAPDAMYEAIKQHQEWVLQ